jgi:hypothetical protein
MPLRHPFSRDSKTAPGSTVHVLTKVDHETDDAIVDHIEWRGFGLYNVVYYVLRDITLG